ncbi:hypothetical protein FG93_05446 [Bosea sp. LC85]|uniref:DUF1289 domain-containing protein n=1 Tax=Bosea sp. LC85 TaxID=1502851 RepID=UPI0004E3FEAF|nr:DUF1289 domain-containing protein [Bosea sp. LC85]KFC63936.1 hypothetical protein FG93_05446 [Bosea sp. LC85]
MSGTSSPCVQICVIDPASGLCEGCLRTLQEIADWSRLSEAERLAIMAELPRRKISPDEPDRAAG